MKSVTSTPPGERFRKMLVPSLRAKRSVETDNFAARAPTPTKNVVVSVPKRGLEVKCLADADTCVAYIRYALDRVTALLLYAVSQFWHTFAATLF